MKYLIITGVAVLAGIAGLIYLQIWSDRKKREAHKRRFEWLLSKYGDPAIVTKIMNRTVWMGETESQLLDSLGNPADIIRRF